MSLCSSCARANISCPVYPLDTRSCVEYIETASYAVPLKETEVITVAKKGKGKPYSGK